MHIIAFLCHTQIIYNTNTYLWTASNVRIPRITVIITDFWCVRKSHAVTLCMYLSLSLVHSLTLSPLSLPSHSHSLSRTLSHYRTLCLSPPHTLTHFLFLSPPLSPSLPLSPFYVLNFFLTLSSSSLSPALPHTWLVLVGKLLFKNYALWKKPCKPNYAYD